jgi:hypothetical protein
MSADNVRAQLVNVTDYKLRRPEFDSGHSLRVLIVIKHVPGSESTHILSS